jgi:hypothetical protein
LARTTSDYATTDYTTSGERYDWTLTPICITRSFDPEPARDGVYVLGGMADHRRREDSRAGRPLATTGTWA